MFNLLTPRARQLAHWKTCPPAWLSALLAWIVVAVVDILCGFDTDGYRASVWEWLGYGGGSLLLVSWYSGLLSELTRSSQETSIEQVETAKCITLQDLEKAPWHEIEAWLKSDEPAQYDFLENQSVAHRVTLLVAGGTRSVGIVGPFGAGKTSIIRWVTDRLKRHEVGGPKYFVCQHSCWGFETSASAIHDMLKSAVSRLGAEIDTFEVDSLPESYRQTFSAGGDWVETISKLVLRTPDPMEQFSRLSSLLEAIGGRLIFIVEDLDRNETRNFEIQEVLAFLERLKDHSNLSFILTGGLSSSLRIDYAKLCDHIEFLRTIQPKQSSRLIERVCQHCLDNSVFPHVRLGDPNGHHIWNPLSGLLMLDYEEFPLPQAVATLLNTPRSLRHALGRTFSAWHTLHGEIDFHHLLAVNILRLGAPECFQFLMRRRDRLRSLPDQTQLFGKNRKDEIRQAVLDDWKQTITNVEWNPAAALQVMSFIIPTTEYWLVDASKHSHSKDGQQQVTEERYWIRAITEAIGVDDVRDQEVVRDIQAWLAVPGRTSDLVSKLISSSRYGDVWEYFASAFFADQRDKILQLCEQVIQRIMHVHGSSASGDSQGFIHTWRFSLKRVSNGETNSKWLLNRIEEAAKISLKMANDVWYYYGNPRKLFVRHEEMLEIRQQLLNSVRANVTDGESLIARLSANSSATLYQLVFDPGRDEQSFLTDIQSWSWLGPMILDGVRKRNCAVAANCGVLLGARVSGRERMTVDTEVLDQFFGQHASEIIDILDSMIDQIPEDDRLLIRNVVGAARQHLAGGS